MYYYINEYYLIIREETRLKRCRIEQEKLQKRKQQFEQVRGTDIV